MKQTKRKTTLAPFKQYVLAAYLTFGAMVLILCGGASISAIYNKGN